MVEGEMHPAEHLISEMEKKPGRVAMMRAWLERVQDEVRATAEKAQQIVAGEGWPVPVLNGVFGDTLAARNSSLAIEMKLLGEVQTGKLCIFVHGLCDSEKAWLPGDIDGYGAQLEQDFGFDSLYLRYNTGQHISTNGRLLAQLIDDLSNNAGTPIEEIIFIAHSMGGLVVRSACHYGQRTGEKWVSNVDKIFFLGTPHEGNDYEKIGNLTSTILRVIPNPVTWGISILANTRSAGIKDLRYGYLLDEDWQHCDANALWQNNRHAVSLLANTKHYIITAALAEDMDNGFKQYFGDGVVMAKSAKGLSLEEGFLSDHLKTISGLTHLGLLRDLRVYEQIYSWVSIA